MMRRRFPATVLLLFAVLLIGCNTSRPAADAAPPPTAVQEPAVYGFIDKPVPKERVARTVVVAGWTFATGSPVREVAIWLDGQKVAVAAYGGARPDVAKQYPAHPAAALSGWYTEVNAASLPPGAHEIVVRAALANGTERPLGTVSISK